MYKDFPIATLHPQAPLAAEAAECAGEQGRYWEMHRTLFAAPSQWAVSASKARSTFGRYATDHSLDTEQFDACMAEGRYRANVEANLAEGRYLGVTGTPAFVINGKLLAGAQPAEIFRRVFDRELASLEEGTSSR